MNLAQEMGAENLRAQSDSQLMTSQITGEYQTNDNQITKYLPKVKKLAEKFMLLKPSLYLENRTPALIY